MKIIEFVEKVSQSFSFPLTFYFILVLTSSYILFHFGLVLVGTGSHVEIWDTRHAPPCPDFFFPLNLLFDSPTLGPGTAFRDSYIFVAVNYKYCKRYLDITQQFESLP